MARSELSDVPLIREALRRHFWRQIRLICWAFLIGCFVTWFAKDRVVEWFGNSDPTASAPAPKFAHHRPPSPSHEDQNEKRLLSDEEFFAADAQGAGGKLSAEAVGNEALVTEEPSVATAVPLPKLKPRSISLEEAYATLEGPAGGLDCPEARRPLNGAVIVGHSAGAHELIIENGTASDAIVKLRASKGTDAMVFYVHGRATARFDIPEGSYSVLFATGHKYSHACDRFLEDFQTWRFPGIQHFISRRDGNYMVYTVVEFTLHSVPSGNIDKKKISEDEWFG